MTSRLDFARHFVAAHHRLLVAVVTGACTALLSPHALDAVTRALLGWNTGLWVYLVLMWALFVRTGPAGIRVAAARQDQRAGAVLASICAGALASLAAIAFEMAGKSDGAAAVVPGAAQAVAMAPAVLRYLVAASTIIGGWSLVPTVFTVHYTHLYYTGGGALLRFPENPDEPDYLDFAYFAFTISIASQTADVVITSRRGRRLVLAQSLLAFLFNAFVVAMAVNIGAGLV